jgi:hypothetical protein
MKKLITICVVVGLLLTVSADVKGVTTRLLLHFDDNMNDSSGQNHPITPYGGARLDTTEKKFGSASLLLDGSDDYLTSANGHDWNITANTTDAWTVDFWVQHDKLSGDATYLTYQQTSSAKWFISHSSSSGLSFSGYSISLPGGGKILDNNWHWIALCKVADKLAMYEDGKQVNYGQMSIAKSVDGLLTIGSRQGGVNFFGGNMDNLRIANSNFLGASPNINKTDVISYVSNPEPTTIALLGLGALSLIRRKK